MGHFQIIQSKLSEADQAILQTTLCKSGKRKGCFLANAPSASKDINRFVAWHALRAARHFYTWRYMPNDCGVCGMMMYGDSTTTELFERVFDATIAAIEEITASKKG